MNTKYPAQVGPDVFFSLHYFIFVQVFRITFKLGATDSKVIYNTYFGLN